MDITRADYDAWLMDSVTREVRKVLLERQDKIAHALAAGGALEDEKGVNVGRYLEINDLLLMTYEDMLPE